MLKLIIITAARCAAERKLKSNQLLNIFLHQVHMLIYIKPFHIMIQILYYMIHIFYLYSLLQTNI